MADENDVPVVIETPAEEPETPAVEAPEPEAEAAPNTEPEAPDERDQRIADLEEKNKKLFARAKAAEEAKKAPIAAPQEQMSVTDMAALVKSDVHEDDFERVEKFAKSEGISIREALKSDELQAILGVRNEKRVTAKAANVSNVRRGPAKATGETLLENARNGRIPDDDASIEAIVAAASKRK